MPIHPDTERVLNDIAARREAQVAKGYTREHDDKHTMHEMLEIAYHLIVKCSRPFSHYTRNILLDAAAVLVAAIESHDRRTNDNSSL